MIDDTQTMEHIAETNDTTIDETHIEVQEPKPKVRKTREKKKDPKPKIISVSVENGTLDFDESKPQLQPTPEPVDVPTPQLQPTPEPIEASKPKPKAKAKVVRKPKAPKAEINTDHNKEPVKSMDVDFPKLTIADDVLDKAIEERLRKMSINRELKKKESFDALFAQSISIHP
jgi:hypothetical protein